MAIYLPLSQYYDCIDMAKTKQLSVYVRQKMVNFHKLGKGYGTISKCLDIPQSIVQSIVNKLKGSGTTTWTWKEDKIHSYSDKQNMQRDEYEP